MVKKGEKQPEIRTGISAEKWEKDKNMAMIFCGCLCLP